jgi:hypothetical protein
MANTEQRRSAVKHELFTSFMALRGTLMWLKNIRLAGGRGGARRHIGGQVMHSTMLILV